MLHDSLRITLRKAGNSKLDQRILKNIDARLHRGTVLKYHQINNIASSPDKLGGNGGVDQILSFGTKKEEIDAKNLLAQLVYQLR